MTENFAPLAWAAATTSCRKYAESARTMIIPGVVARRRVARLSAISLAAPWPESMLPLRSRVAAITGAASGVDRIATWAFNPSTRL